MIAFFARNMNVVGMDLKAPTKAIWVVMIASWFQEQRASTNCSFSFKIFLVFFFYIPVFYRNGAIKPASQCNHGAGLVTAAGMTSATVCCKMTFLLKV